MKKIRSFVGLLAILLLASCTKNESVSDKLSVWPNLSEYPTTLFVYMVGEEVSLNPFSYTNVDDMERSLKGVPLAQILIYRDPFDALPSLIQLKTSRYGDVQRTVLKTYPEENSASSTVLARVLGEMSVLSQSPINGLILWSHATAWLPAAGSRARNNSGITFPNDGLARAFGQDENIGSSSGSKQMDIRDLAAAIPIKQFDFFLFDCCYMGSLETLYEFRDKTSYIVASPAEIPIAGFPYSKVTPLFFKSENLETRLLKVSQTFYEHYEGFTTPMNKTGTISLIKTAELKPLAQQLLDIERLHAEAIAAIDLSSMQRLDRMSPSLFYDLGEYVKTLATPAEWANFQIQLAKTILYSAHTEYIFNGASRSFKINTFSGLSYSYPARTNSTFSDFYKQLSIFAN